MTQSQLPPEGLPTPKTGEQQSKEKEVKLFSRSNGIPRSVVVRVHLPKLMPDVVFGFKLRLALSKEFQDSTEQLAARPASEVAAAQKGQILGEVCDLLQEPPSGFSDWPEDDKRAPGDVFHDYVTKTTDPEAKFILEQVVSGVSNLYWFAVTPREFLPKT